jgi:hypothetical protein
MTENNMILIDELRPLVADISRKVLDKVSPDESSMIDFFMESYCEPLAIHSEQEADAHKNDIPLGIGSPDIMAALVIPLVLSILTELVKEGVIPAVKKRFEEKEKRSKQTTFEINEKMEKIGKNYELSINVRLKNPKLAKKIIAAVLVALKSNL